MTTITIIDVKDYGAVTVEIDTGTTIVTRNYVINETTTFENLKQKIREDILALQSKENIVNILKSNLNRIINL